MRSAIHKLDVFPKFDAKFEQDAREKTLSGAILSIFALLCILMLLIGELNYYFRIETKHDLYVDTNIDSKIDIQCSIIFPFVPCELMSVDAVDSFGEFQKDLEKRATKTRLSREGTPIDGPTEDKPTPSAADGAVETTLPGGCGSCYGAGLRPGQCCNTCDDVRAAYQARGWSFKLSDASIVQCNAERAQYNARITSNEGCRIDSQLKVKKVQGNLHFVPGRTVNVLGQHMHDVNDVKTLNLSHTIVSLQFGQPFPGLRNPLDGRIAQMETEEEGKTNSKGGRFQYYIKVVPTRYERLDGSSVETNQYSVTEHFSMIGQDALQGLPGVFFIYDLSPIKVYIYESRPYGGLAHFLLQLCAICGGVFTVMSLIDAAMYHGSIRIRRKIMAGKMS